MRAMVMAAAVMLVAGGASAATRGVTALIDFEDVAIGSYTSLFVDGYVFSSDKAFNIVAGDPTQATSNASKLLAVSGSGVLTMARADGQDFVFAGAALSYEVTNYQASGPYVFGPRYISSSFPGSSTTYSSNEGDPTSVEIDYTGFLKDFSIFFPPPADGTFALDNLHANLVAAVPLPASALLLGVALTGLGLVRRHRS